MTTPSKVYRTYYDVSRIVLWADNPAEEGRRARLVLGFRDGQPRLTVYTGVPGRDGVIAFPMDIPNFAATMLMLKDIANGEKDKQIKGESLTSEYKNDKPTGQKRVVSTMHLGKTKEGIVYISLTSEDKPKIIFPFQPSSFHTFLTQDKQPLDPDYVSKCFAIGIAEVFLGIVGKVILAYTNDEYDASERKPAVIQGATGGSRSPAGKAPAAFQDLDDLAL